MMETADALGAAHPWASSIATSNPTTSCSRGAGSRMVTDFGIARRSPPPLRWAHGNGCRDRHAPLHEPPNRRPGTARSTGGPPYSLSWAIRCSPAICRSRRRFAPAILIKQITETRNTSKPSMGARRSPAVGDALSPEPGELADRRRAATGAESRTRRRIVRADAGIPRSIGARRRPQLVPQSDDPRRPPAEARQQGRGQCR